MLVTTTLVLKQGGRKSYIIKQFIELLNVTHAGQALHHLMRIN